MVSPILGLQPVIKYKLNLNEKRVPKRVNEDGDESGPCKWSGLMQMVRKLPKKGLHIIHPAEF